MRQCTTRFSQARLRAGQAISHAPGFHDDYAAATSQSPRHSRRPSPIEVNAPADTLIYRRLLLLIDTSSPRHFYAARAETRFID